MKGICNDDLRVSSEGAISFGIDSDANSGCKNRGRYSNHFKSGSDFTNVIISSIEIAEGDDLTEGTIYSIQ